AEESAERALADLDPEGLLGELGAETRGALARRDVVLAHLEPRPVARGACAHRVIARHQLETRHRRGRLAGARGRLRERERLAGGEDRTREAIPDRERLLERLADPLPRAILEREAIDEERRAGEHRAVEVLRVDG